MVDSQETIQQNKNDIEDFRDAIRSKKSKQKIESDSWTRAKVTDIQVYTGYELTPIPGYLQNTSAQFIRILSSDKPEEAVKDIDESDSLTKEVGSEEYDGIVSHEGKEYFYNDKKWVVGELESVDSSYNTYMIIEDSNTDAPRLYKESLELIDKEVFVSTQDESRIRESLIGEDNKASNALVTENIPSAISRKSPQLFLLIGFLASSGLALTFSSFYSFIFASILMSSVLNFSMSMENNIYAGFRKVRLTNDILPSSDSRVTNEMPNPDKRQKPALNPVFDLVEAKVDVTEDNSIVISTDDSVWTFESDSGDMVSGDAVEVYKTFEDMKLDSPENFIVRTTTEDDVKSLTSNMYKSDDGNKVLKIEYGD